MARINVVIIHGIGNEKQGYSKELMDGLIKEFNAQLKSILKTEGDYSSEIQFKEIIWEDIVSKNQKELEKILAASETPMVREKGLWKTVCYWLKSLIRGLRSVFAPQSICDIIGYKDPFVYFKIHQHVLNEINAIKKDTNKSNLTFISHSLGTVIAYDFVYDQQNKLTYMHKDFQLTNFFTLGSPLAIFVLQYENSLFKEPIKLEDTYGRWINIFDKDDPIAYQLKPLNNVYDKAILRDYRVDTGPFGVAHLFYWGNRDVHKIIGRKLTIDWIRLNNKLTSKEIIALYDEYDKTLGTDIAHLVR